MKGIEMKRVLVLGLVVFWFGDDGLCEGLSYGFEFGGVSGAA